MSERVTVALAEYASLRDEIHQRINYQLIIIGASAALVAALVPVLAGLDLHHQAEFLLVVPPVFLLIACLYYEQHLVVTEIASFISHNIRPLIMEEVGNDERLLGWESFRRHETPRKFRFGLHAVRLASTAVIAPVCLSVGLSLRLQNGARLPFYWWIDLTFVIEMLLAVWLGYIIYKLWQVFHGIPRASG